MVADTQLFLLSWWMGFVVAWNAGLLVGPGDCLCHSGFFAGLFSGAGNRSKNRFQIEPYELDAACSVYVHRIRALRLSAAESAGIPRGRGGAHSDGMGFVLSVDLAP